MNIQFVTPKLYAPAFVNLDAPFFGLFSAPSTAEVALFLFADSPRAYSISEIARATGLSRISVKAAVSLLTKWGQIETANPGFPRLRYMANEDSPLTMAIHLMTAATAQALWPEDGDFAGTVDEVRKHWRLVVDGAPGHGDLWRAAAPRPGQRNRSPARALRKESTVAAQARAARGAAGPRPKR